MNTQRDASMPNDAPKQQNESKPRNESKPHNWELTRLLVGRELRANLNRPGSWILFSGFLLGAGLFYSLRLAAGEGGDHGGFLREMGAVLLPVGCLCGAATQGSRERLRSYLACPVSPGTVTLALLAPAWLWCLIFGMVGGMLPLLTLGEAPLDLGFLLAGGLALSLLGMATASLGAAWACFLGHPGAGALVAFLVSLACWGASGVAAALGLEVLSRLDLTAGLLLAGRGWFSFSASSPALLLLVTGAWGLREALEAQRW